MVLALKVDFWRQLGWKIAPDAKLNLFFYLFWAILGGIPVWIAALVMLFGTPDPTSWLPGSIKGLLFAAMGATLILSTWKIVAYHRFRLLLLQAAMIVFFSLIDPALGVGTGIMVFSYIVISFITALS